MTTPEIQRYDLIGEGYGDGGIGPMSDGDYVLHSDHAAAIRQRDERIQRLEALLGELLPCWHADDDGTGSGNRVAGEITWREVRSIKAALAGD